MSSLIVWMQKPKELNKKKLSYNLIDIINFVYLEDFFMGHQMLKMDSNSIFY